MQLRADNLQGRAAEQQARFQQVAERDHSSSEHFNRKIVKTARDCVDGADHKLIYVKWPQYSVFIGPDKKRVRYDGLSQGQ